VADRRGGIGEGVEAPRTSPARVVVVVHTPAIVTSLGLVSDIAGAWLVAWEIVRQYHGRKYQGAKSWETISTVTETGPSKLMR